MLAGAVARAEVLGIAQGASLAEIRAAWKQAVRENHPDAMIARFGGEEFALMVPHCTVPVLLKRLEGLRQQLRQQPLSRETPLFVRASFGVINVGRVSMDEALSEADRLLYQAKNTGRDKIVSQETAI